MEGVDGCASKILAAIHMCLFETFWNAGQNFETRLCSPPNPRRSDLRNDEKETKNPPVENAFRCLQICLRLPQLCRAVSSSLAFEITAQQDSRSEMYTRKLHGYFRAEAPLFLPALVSVDPELGVYFLDWRAMLMNCEGFSLSVRCSLYFSRKCGEVNNLLPSKRQYQEKATESFPQSIFSEDWPVFRD